ncbi:MAG TPA: hypothetical protein VFN23_14170, partial [Ktedonobacteraceae bacterium]|nr:hypothetical protein [Ktedonobacteraceae bacterium]
MQVIDSVPTIKKKPVGCLSMTARKVLAAGLARLQDSSTEFLPEQGHQLTPPVSPPSGFFPILALVSASGLLVVAIAYYMGSYSTTLLDLLFLLGLAIMYVPCFVRLVSPAPSRFERMSLLAVVGINFFLVQLMVSPNYISPYDSMLHWINADTLLSVHHLFNINSLLPVSPYYPGLEIITNALSSISGLNTFEAGSILVAVVRLLMVCSLYLFYEQVMQSGRLAGIAVMIYMTNPHFAFFDAIFSYETLALPIVTFILYTLIR